MKRPRAAGSRSGAGRRRRGAGCALGGLERTLGQPEPALAHYQKVTRSVHRAGGRAGGRRRPGAASALPAPRWGTAGAAASPTAGPRAPAPSRPSHRGRQGAQQSGPGPPYPGELREALGFYQQALDVFETAGEQGLWKANVLLNLATAYGSLGEPDAALAAPGRSSSCSAGSATGGGETRTLINLGVLYYNLGDFGRGPRSLRDRRSLRPASSATGCGKARCCTTSAPPTPGWAITSARFGHFEPALAIRREAGARKEGGQDRDRDRSTRAFGSARPLRLSTSAAGPPRRRAPRPTAEGEMLARLLARQAHGRRAGGTFRAVPGSRARPPDRRPPRRDRGSAVPGRSASGRAAAGAGGPGARAGDRPRPLGQGSCPGGGGADRPGPGNADAGPARRGPRRGPKRPCGSSRPCAPRRPTRTCAPRSWPRNAPPSS